MWQPIFKQLKDELVDRISHEEMTAIEQQGEPRGQYKQALGESPPIHPHASVRKLMRQVIETGHRPCGALQTPQHAWQAGDDLDASGTTA